ncbi:transposase [Streptomyces sp. NPDC056361]|uniref:transposase n=1 Tax=Streptomyces sp. NPDC056361 TaxID=3345795 RepID=UPI0035DEA56E
MRVRTRGRWRDHRRVFEGIVFKFPTGLPWRDLPERFGRGRPSTDGSRAGPPTAPSTVSRQRPSRGRRWTGWSRSTPPTCEPISTRPPKGARRTRTGTLLQWADQQNPPRRR